jgi:hypothetical protein
MDGLLEKKAYKEIVFAWAAEHGFTPVESEINDLLWSLEKIVSSETSLTAPTPQPVSEYKGWYCSHCQRGVDGREVTNCEQHEVCGRVITDDRPPVAQPLSGAALEALQGIENCLDLEGVLSDENAKRIALLKQALAQAGGRWLPIETAPKDGTLIIAYTEIDPNYSYAPWLERSLVRYKEERWELENAIYADASTVNPSHWMPLPAVPVAAKEGGE